MGKLRLHQRSNSQPPCQISGSTSSQRSDALAQEAQVAEVALYDVLVQYVNLRVDDSEVMRSEQSETQSKYKTNTQKSELRIREDKHHRIEPPHGGVHTN
jgi:hypothetical protein